MPDQTILPFRPEVFRAVLDRIIPRDDYPSATDNGVDRFILALFDADVVAGREAIDRGLLALDQTAGGRFEQFSAAEQDDVLKAHDRDEWFQMLCELAAEGYYADPANGGNPAAISWEMIGYRPGLPEGPAGPAENPQDAVPGRLWA